METTKRYQSGPSKQLCQKKPESKQQLGLDDEVSLVLMCIHQDSPIEDLAFRFKNSARYASNIFTISTIFLARKLKPLIIDRHPSKHCHTNMFNSQVILIKLKELGTLLGSGFKDCEILKLSSNLQHL